MKNRLLVLILCFNFSIIMNARAEMMNPNVTRTIEQHIQDDNRLVDYNKRIGFIELLKNELVDKKGILQLKNLDNGQLTLTNDIHFTIKRMSVNVLTDKITRQPIGEKIIYKIINVGNERQEAILSVFLYNAGNNFIYSRDNFLNTIEATTMPLIPFLKGPNDLGTVSINIIKREAHNKIVWIDHNIFFILDASHINDKYFLDIAYWVQQQIIKDEL